MTDVEKLARIAELIDQMKADIRTIIETVDETRIGIRGNVNAGEPPPFLRRVMDEKGEAGK